MTQLEQQVEALTQQFQAFLANQNQQNHNPYDLGDDAPRSDDFWEVPRQRCRTPIHFEDDRRQDDRRQDDKMKGDCGRQGCVQRFLSFMVVYNQRNFLIGCVILKRCWISRELLTI